MEGNFQGTEKYVIPNSTNQLNMDNVESVSRGG